MSKHKVFRLSRWLAVLLLITLLATLIPAGVAGAAKKKCDTRDIIRRGDTLTSIARKFGLDANTIVKANNSTIFPKKYLIFVGVELCIPDKIDKEAPKIEVKYTTVPAIYFTAFRSGDNVYITTNYSWKYPTLLVGPAGKPVRLYKQVKNPVVESDSSYHFELPDKLKKVDQLQVCLRTIFRNKSWQCVSVR